MIQSTWDRDRGIIIRHCEGEVSFDDMVVCTKEGPKRPDFDAYHTTIWNFGKVNFADDPDHMARLMPFVRDFTKDTGKGRKIAWVTKSPFARALLEEFFHNHNWSSDWQCFETLDAAIVWAGSKSQPGSV